MKTIYRSIPSIDKILNHPRLLSMEKDQTRDLQVYFARKTIGSYRKTQSEPTKIPTIDEFVDEIIKKIDQLKTPSSKNVINASGVILHTNLGRAPLSNKTNQIIQLINSNLFKV